MRAVKVLSWLLIPCLVLATMPGRAEMIGTPQLLQAGADADRAKVATFLERADVQDKLVSLGVSPADAQARVASLSQDELQQLSGRIDSLPAGADGVELLLLVLIVLLILELAGVIDIFKN